MKLVYIASPYAGKIEKNILFAKQACRYCIECGNAPIAVHLLYPLLLDDTNPIEREQGLRLGLRVLEACDELWVAGDRVSRGMKLEIEQAERLGIPIRTVSETEILDSKPFSGKQAASEIQIKLS